MTILIYIFHGTTLRIMVNPLLESHLGSATNFNVHKAQLSDANYMAILCMMVNPLRYCSTSFDHLVINFNYLKDLMAFHL
jgi:hypothetical protein